MSTNSQEIVQQVREEFESVLTFVLKATPQTVPDADTMERSLFRRLFDLGCLLLRLYFVQQNQLLAPQSVPGQDKTPIPWHSDKERSYLSIFGRVHFARRYYYRKGEGDCPLDATLNLPAEGASDLVREWREKLCAYLPYHQTEQIVEELLSQRVSTRQLQQDIEADAEHVRAFYAQAQKPIPAPEASILVVQADGKGVPMRQTTPAAQKVRKQKGEKTSHKKEAVVTSVYTLAPCVRSPEAVVASLFEDERASETRPLPQNKRVFATLKGKATALLFTAKQVWQQHGGHIRHKVALTDGSDALQERVQAQFPDFTLILDCIHAIEYLWKAANGLLGETAPERTEWVKRRVLWMLSGQTEALIDDLHALAASAEATTKKTLLAVAAYYERNRAFMQYDQYLACGWPIATGVIEGACRHLVKDRCELSGMRWTQSGAEALLQLRSVAENGDWEAFHAYRRSQRQVTRYGKTLPSQPQIELRMAA
jgi:hypothetical protein